MKYLRKMASIVPNIFQNVQQSVSPTAQVEKIVYNKYIPGEEQTKDWRKSQSWYIDGKHNECELFQRKQVETMIGSSCIKTNMRFNTENYELHNITRPLDHTNGFEWTEDFDGLSIIDEKKLYFNFKFICDAGGAQTRSLREVYHFVKCQLEFYAKDQPGEKDCIDNIYFINILDGNTAMKHLSKFKYLIEKEKYKNVASRIYIGDMYTFNTWYDCLQKESP